MISIVIPTIHHVELVKQCVRTLRQTAADIPNEIIVVDDGSSEPIRQALSQWAAETNVRFIPKPVNEGFSRTVNAGIREASGAYVLLVNNDVVFHEAGWLDRMLQALNASPDIGIVGARLLYPDHTIQHGGVVPGKHGYFDHRFRGRPSNDPPALAVEEIGAVTGALMLIRKELLADIGLFAEDFFIAFEDVDFCFRAKRKGWKIVYCGAASAIHLEGRTRGNRLANKNRFWRIKELEARRRFWEKWGEIVRQ